MNKTTVKMKYADGRTSTRENDTRAPIMDLLAEIREQYPEAVAYDRSGNPIFEERDFDGHDVLIWASEEDSQDDDGQNAIAVICAD